MNAGQLDYFFGAFALSLVCSTLAKWLAAVLGAENEAGYGIALAACFMPTAIPLLAYGAFGFADALAMLAAMLAATVMFWWFRRDASRVVDVQRPRAS
jgi:hypothetical protein